MKRNRAFTLNEVLIVLAIVIVAFVLLVVVAGSAILLPALGASRRAARQMQNSTQVRGVQAGMVIYAQGNNSYYPGLDEYGNIDPEVGLSPQGRISRLIEDNYFSLEYARSPAEAQTRTTSYALLQVNTNENGDGVAKGGRNDEWKDTTNSESVVISDRAVPMHGSYTKLYSIHTTPSGVSDWRGSVGWNDNHVTFESTSHLSTIYADSNLKAGRVSHLIDALFASPGNAHSGDDAFMVWNGTSDL